jgi:hypothetical protein
VQNQNTPTLGAIFSVVGFFNSQKDPLPGMFNSCLIRAADRRDVANQDWFGFSLGSATAQDQQSPQADQTSQPMVHLSIAGTWHPRFLGAQVSDGLFKY